MANQKISELPAATLLTGDELIPVVQGGVNKSATPNDIVALVPSGGGSSSGTLGAVQLSDGAGGFSSDDGLSYSSGALTVDGSLVIGNTPFTFMEFLPNVLQLGDQTVLLDINLAAFIVNYSIIPGGGTGNLYDLGSPTTTVTSPNTIDPPVVANQATTVGAVASSEPITPGSVIIFPLPAGSPIYDDGAGNLVGGIGSGGTNTINYTTGQCNFSFGSGGPYTGANVTSSFPLASDWRTGYFGTSVVTPDVVMSSGATSVIILPTADPLVTGALWNNLGTITISAGP